jgi:hypothetical protein
MSFTTVKEYEVPVITLPALGAQRRNLDSHLTLLPQAFH